MKNLQDEAKKEKGLLTPEEASTVIGNLPGLIQATLQLLFELETAVGEWDQQLGLPPISTLQAGLVGEIRGFLQHVERSLLTIEILRLREPAIAPLLVSSPVSLSSSSSSPRPIETLSSSGRPFFYYLFIH